MILGPGEDEGPLTEVSYLEGMMSVQEGRPSATNRRF